MLLCGFRNGGVEDLGWVGGGEGCVWGLFLGILKFVNLINNFLRGGVWELVFFYINLDLCIL